MPSTFARSLTNLCTGNNTKLLSSCRPSLPQYPALWLSMTRSECNHILCWRLDWLPGSKPNSCLYYPNNGFTCAHSIKCLDMHRCLQPSMSVEDLIFFILNKLPLKKFRYCHETPAGSFRWYAVCIVLNEMYNLFHDQISPLPLDPGAKLVNWLSS